MTTILSVGHSTHAEDAFADALLARGCRVRHLMPDATLAEHRPRDFVRLEDDLLVYDVRT